MDAVTRETMNLPKDTVEALRRCRSSMNAPAEQPGVAGLETADPLISTRIRTYYAALGYGAPYEWRTTPACRSDPLRKPLAECRVALVTTAAPYQPDKGDQGPVRPTIPRRNSTRSIRSTRRRTMTCASRTSRSIAPTPPPRTRQRLPLPALRDAAARGPSDRWPRASTACRPTAASASRIETDCPELVARCQADGADVGVSVPTVRSVTRASASPPGALEESGIATVVMGCARDIVEHVGVRAACSSTSRSATRRGARAIRIAGRDPRPCAARA